MTTNLHAHVFTASADCDGPLHSHYVTALNDAELAHHAEQDGINDFHDLMFKERVMGNHVSFHAHVSVSVTPSGFTMSEQTDEGYRSAEVCWCEDAKCDPHAAYQRDVYAEMMGY